MRVLVVATASLSSKTLAQALQSNRVIVDQSQNGAEAIDLVKHYNYDVIIADELVPDTGGYELIRQLRAAGLDTPVIFQVEHNRPEARIKAFGVGADDVIITPCNSDELLARMQAIVRRSKGYSQPSLRCGQVQLNPGNCNALVLGRPVHLTAKEYAVLELLMLRKGVVLTKEVFLNHLYSEMNEPGAKIIDVFICKLRRKLADAGAPGVIITIWDRGYTFRSSSKQSTLAAIPEAEIALLECALSA